MLSCFPRGVLDEILNLIESVSEDYPSYSWVHYYEPENIAPSRQWVVPGTSMSKKLRAQPSAGKVMAKVFWDAKGVIMIDFLPKRSTINEVY